MDIPQNPVVLWQQVTDSFHGLVFSLLYHRQFAVIPIANGLSSRLLDLLDLVGLEDHVFTSQEELEKNIQRRARNEPFPANSTSAEQKRE